ncbi:hypothetical protein IFR05_011281 [Cadophora sp. M221]|nr:hypothetical protein IFR05_011281 [Cadophora sp. M221]
MAAIPHSTTTHVFKTIDGLELTLDITSPKTAPSSSSKTALVHFHGGFLVIGEKTTFPPAWLINACLRRGWTYVTPSYRLVPESTGKAAVSDAIAACEWVQSHVSKRLVVAGSSAGAYLGLTAAAILLSPPLAQLFIYGMLDPVSHRYVIPGIPLMADHLLDTSKFLEIIKNASEKGPILDAYPFPADPTTDLRMGWIATLHQEALYPDYITGKPGLSKLIRENGIEAIPEEDRCLFAAAPAETTENAFPPTAFIHGDADQFISIDQSVDLANKFKASGSKVTTVIVPGKAHGFDIIGVPSDVDIESTSTDGEEWFSSFREVLGFLDAVISNVASNSTQLL